MKTFIKMPNNITKVLNSKDTYRYVALSFTPIKKGFTDATFIQIGEYINPLKPESEYTVKGFIQRLKKAGLMQIDEVFEKGLRRNRYYVPQPKTNFRMVRNEFLYDETPIELKGFLLQLLSITMNETFKVLFSITKISTLVKISKPTAFKYMKELLERGLVIEIDGGYEITSTFFTLGKTSREKEIDAIKDSIPEEDKYLKAEFNRANWDAIDYPQRFWDAKLLGVLGKKKLRSKLDNENLTIIL